MPGHILTNYHVAGGATKLEVFWRRKQVSGEVGGEIPRQISIIIFLPGGLPCDFGDSDKGK